MRKLKLFMATFALVGGSVAAMAQTDVTSTYLTNADFSKSTAISSNLKGYGKDGTPYGFQDVNDWNYEVLNADNSNATYPNSGMGGAVFAYGSSYELQGGNKSAPASAPDGGTTGNCLGFFAVWGCGGYYYQDVTLPAGKYTITVPMYNQSGTQANTSYTGFFPTEGEAKTVAVNPTVGSWVNQTVTFTLATETAGQIRLGYKSTGSGSGANPHIFIDCVKIEYTDIALGGAQDILEGFIKKAEALNSVLGNANLTSAISSAKTTLASAKFSTDVENAANELKSAIDDALDNASSVSLVNGDFNTSPNINKDGSSSVQFIEPATEAKPYIYPVYGWTPNFKFNSTASQGTTAFYGATITGDKGNNGTNPPSADMLGSSEGAALHLSSGWGDQARYKQVIESLPSGRYLFYYEANNQNASATTLVDNFFGVSGSAGDFYGTSNSFVYSDAKSFPYNEWVANAFEFDVAKESTVTFHVGVTGSTGGSASAPKLWVDNVLIYRIADIIVTDEDANKIIAEAEGLSSTAMKAEYKSELNQTLSDFKGSKTMSDYIKLNSALAKAQESANIYKKLDVAIKNAESWSKQGTAATLRSKYNEGKYDDEATETSIYEEYQSAEISALADNDALDWTSALLNPSFETGDLTGWSAEKRDDTGAKENSNSTYTITGADGKYVFNTWGGTAENNVYQTVKGLPAGTYTLSALLAGFNGEELVLAAGGETSSVTVEGDKTVGYTVNVVFEHSGGDLLIKASNTKSQETSDRSFLKADNFRLMAGGLANDYTDLNTAINLAESKKLGFESGEYAPYNNVEALEALVKAKAIDQEGDNSQSYIDGLVEKLNNWTANSGEVDIIFNGHFAQADGWNPLGWSRSNGAWGQQISGIEASTGAENGTAWYYNTEGAWEYGKAGVYTMPLPENTWFTLTFKYRSHEDNSNNWMKASVLNEEGEGLSETQFEKNGSKTNFVTAKATFCTGAAGNYILSLYQSGNTHLTDVSIVKATPESVTVGRDGYATYVPKAPMDFSASAIKAYTAKVADGKVVLTQIEKVAAGTPVVLCCEGGKTEDIPFAATTDTPAESDLVAGNGATVATTDGDYTNYILNVGTQGIGFYQANDQTVDKGRAYLHVAGSSEARLAVVFGDATGISSVKAAADGEVVYNLNGQRVKNASKGLFIIGGKKVVVK